MTDLHAPSPGARSVRPTGSTDAPLDARCPVADVLALGLHSPALAAGFQPVDAVAASSSQQVLESLSDRGGPDRPVLAVYPAWSREPVRHWVKVARTAIDPFEIVVYESTLPPAGSAVLATLAGTLARHAASPGALLSLLPVVERQLQVVTLLTAVHKLSDPNPTLVQHASSVAGSHSFAAVYSGKDRRIVTLKRSGYDLGLPEPSFSAAVHVATGQADPMWMYGMLESYYPHARVGLDDDAQDPHAFWGGSPWIEAVIYPSELNSLIQLERSARALVACRWCGTAGPPTGRVCQFCGVALSPQSLLGDQA